MIIQCYYYYQYMIAIRAKLNQKVNVIHPFVHFVNTDSDCCKQTNTDGKS